MKAGAHPPASCVASRPALPNAKNAVVMRLVDVVDPRLAQVAPTVPARQLVLRQLFHLSPIPRHDLVIIVVNVGIGSNEGDEGPACGLTNHKADSVRALGRRVATKLGQRLTGGVPGARCIRLGIFTSSRAVVTPTYDAVTAKKKCNYSAIQTDPSPPPCPQSKTPRHEVH